MLAGKKYLQFLHCSFIIIILKNTCLYLTKDEQKHFIKFVLNQYVTTLINPFRHVSLKVFFWVIIIFFFSSLFVKAALRFQQFSLNHFELKIFPLKSTFTPLLSLLSNEIKCSWLAIEILTREISKPGICLVSKVLNGNIHLKRKFTISIEI